jgi:hypothetical protein
MTKALHDHDHYAKVCVATTMPAMTTRLGDEETEAEEKVRSCHRICVHLRRGSLWQVGYCGGDARVTQ